jgi:hypothetical protein
MIQIQRYDSHVAMTVVGALHTTNASNRLAVETGNDVSVRVATSNLICTDKEVQVCLVAVFHACPTELLPDLCLWASPLPRLRLPVNPS